MSLMRVTVLALLVACASLAHAAEEIIVSDIDNNEVLPENDVVRARVDEVPAGAPMTTDAPGGGSTPAPTPTAEGAPETTQRAEDAADKTTGPPSASTTSAPKDTDAPTTSAPPRQPSTLSRFLSDIIQIPIAVLRSVGSLLSNTFNGHRGNSSSTTAAPAPSTP